MGRPPGEESRPGAPDAAHQAERWPPPRPALLPPLTSWCPPRTPAWVLRRPASSRLWLSLKITKGTIEIIKDVDIIKAGDRVGMSEATLLNMLKISPFSSGLVISKV